MSGSPAKHNQYRLPVLFTLAVLLAYGIPIFRGWLGFYGDDWIYIQNYRMAGAGSFPAFVAWDRPWSAWIYQITTSLFGDQPLPYHLLLLVQRWLAVFLLWRILKKIWRTSENLVSWTVLLFAVYPGFRQQPIAVQYILHFASLDLCLFSIWCMLRMVQNRAEAGSARNRYLLFAAGIASALIALFSCEYFFGLELTRPFYLAFFLLNQSEQRSLPVKKLLRIWAPYFAVLLLFVYWRVFVFSFQTYQPKLLDSIKTEPVQAAAGMLKQAASDFYTVMVLAWRKTLAFPSISESRSTWLIPILGSLFIMAFYLVRMNRNPDKSDFQRWTHNPILQMILLGVVSLIAAGIPFWTTGIQTEWAFPWDRPALSYSLGSVMLLSAVIPLIFRTTLQPIVIAALIALAIGTHFSSNLIYRDENNKMNDYFWQLAWRAPGLEPGTIIVSEDIPLDRYSDNDLTPVINWQYAPELNGAKYLYKYFDLHLRYESFFADKGAEQMVSHDYRSHQFVSDTDHVLAVTYRPGGCLWIVSPEESNFPGLPDSLAAMALRSNPMLILPESDPSAAPPASLGKEPDHGYCYYFQKINLALQTQNESEAVSLANEVSDRGLQPKNPIDWYPVAKALILDGETEKAKPILESVSSHLDARNFFCEQLPKMLDAVTNHEAESLLTTAGCTP